MSTASHTRKEWAAGLKDALPGFALLTSVQLVGICLFVFAKSRLVDDVRDVETSIVKTGAGGTVGNKGGVAVRFKLHNTRMCFVCSHLAAGKSHVVERNQDMADIARRLDFGKGRSLDSHDYVFWFGDLNYRIELPNEECRAMCAAKAYDKLLAFDQLRDQHLKGNCFVGYQEGIPDFAPTYKYDIMTDEYDTSEKERVPSWTDRVLYKGEGAQLLHYGRTDSLKHSDHRPVLALLEVDAESVNPAIESMVREEIMRKLRRRMATVIVTSREADLTVEEVQEAFRECGPIAMIDQLDGDGTTLVTFENTTSVERALALSGKPLPGETEAVVDVSLLNEQDVESINELDDAASTGEDVSLARQAGIAMAVVNGAAAFRNRVHTGAAGDRRSARLSGSHLVMEADANGMRSATPNSAATEDASSGYGTAASQLGVTPLPDSPPPSYEESLDARAPDYRETPHQLPANAATKASSVTPPPRPKPPAPGRPATSPPKRPTEPTTAPAAAAIGATSLTPTVGSRTSSLPNAASASGAAAPPARPPPPAAGASAKASVPPARPRLPTAAASSTAPKEAAGGAAKATPPPRPQAPSKATSSGASVVSEPAQAVAAVSSSPTTMAIGEPGSASTSVAASDSSAPVVPRRTKSRLHGAATAEASQRPLSTAEPTLAKDASSQNANDSGAAGALGSTPTDSDLSHA